MALEQDDNVFHCGNCQNPFDLKHRKPLTLAACGHAVCKSCYLAVEESEKETSRPIHCPLCHRVKSGHTLPLEDFRVKVKERDASNSKFSDTLTELLREVGRAKRELNFEEQCEIAIGRLCEKRDRELSIVESYSDLILDINSLLTSFKTTRDQSSERQLLQDFIESEVDGFEDVSEKHLADSLKFLDAAQILRTKLFGGVNEELFERVMRRKEQLLATGGAGTTCKNKAANSVSVTVQGLPFNSRPVVEELFDTFWRLADAKDGEEIVELTDKATGVFNGQYLITFANLESVRNAFNKLHGYQLPSSQLPLTLRMYPDEKRGNAEEVGDDVSRGHEDSSSSIKIHPQVLKNMSGSQMSLASMHSEDSKAAKDEGKVYVANIPMSVTKNALFSCFGKIGRIKYAKLYSTPGAPMQTATVVYDDAANVDNAINQLNNTVFPYSQSTTMRMIVKEFGSKQSKSSSRPVVPLRTWDLTRTVVVENVPDFALKSVLAEVFVKAGEIARDSEKQMKIEKVQPGCWRIEYVTVVSALYAYTWFDNIEYPGSGQHLKIKMAVEDSAISSQKDENREATYDNSIFVKNLPFQANFDSIAKEFGRHAPIAKNPDGTLKVFLRMNGTNFLGMCSIEYESVEGANLTVKACNGRRFPNSERTMFVEKFVPFQKR